MKEDMQPAVPTATSQGSSNTGNTLIKAHTRFGNLDIQLDMALVVLQEQLNVVTDGLSGTVQKLANLTSEQRKVYFSEKPEYSRFMEYVNLCPNDDPLTRGSVAGALTYISRVSKSISAELKQLQTQTQRKEYFQSSPNIIALQSWLDKYQAYMSHIH